MKKRGTHVGIVLSFAIFITFLVFLYTVIEPSITTQKDKQFLLDYLERELIKQVSAEMTIFTIMINETINPNKDCVNVQNIISDLLNASDLIVKDEFGNVLNYSISGQGLIIGTGYDFSGFLKFYYSDELPRSPEFEGGGCEPIDKNQYLIGLTKIEKNIFKTKIMKLKERYENEYEILKDELKIPLGSEFGFAFTSSNGTIITTEERKVLMSIYAKEIPIQYVDEEANIKPGFMNLRVW